MILYRKYRPQKFSEVVGQEHVVRTLQGAFQTDSLSHAYLFTGPRGTGKTTLARILAKVVNCAQPEKSDACSRCHFCREIEEGKFLDLIEIDAASNRGIDEIRALREGARFSSVQGKHKIYVIDECHQLTKEASNALLKTIEEPPAKTLFILATTEPHKVLLTIISRLQRFDFKKLSVEQILTKLTAISRREKIIAEPAALRSIALQAEGSLRDAESNLSKLTAFRGEKIDQQAVQEVLGIIPLSLFEQWFKLTLQRQKALALQLVNQVYENGLDLDHFTKGLLDYARRLLVVKADPQQTVFFENEWGREPVAVLTGLAGNLDHRLLFKIIGLLMRAREEMKISPIPQLPLELVVTELTDPTL